MNFFNLVHEIVEKIEIMLDKSNKGLKMIKPWSLRKETLIILNIAKRLCYLLKINDVLRKCEIVCIGFDFLFHKGDNDLILIFIPDGNTTKPMKTPKSLLDKVKFPKDLKKFNDQQLKTLCKELRDEVIDAVSVTGGHLGAGLGVVELTVAIHNVFNTPNDKLIWDVGHQCYPHKVITGRREK